MRTITLFLVSVLCSSNVDTYSSNMVQVPWLPFFFAMFHCAGSTAKATNLEREVETGLVLPVVIRLSQKLSHACLSISIYIAELRIAH